jgi:hypothetical protein
LPATLGVAVPQPQYSGVWVRDDTGGYREVLGAEAVVFALPSEAGGGLIECQPDPDDAESLRLQAIDEPMFVRVAGGVQMMGLHNAGGVLVRPGATSIDDHEEADK